MFSKHAIAFALMGLRKDFWENPTWSKYKAGKEKQLKLFRSREFTKMKLAACLIASAFANRRYDEDKVKKRITACIIQF
jgi:hypothetical protein